MAIVKGDRLQPIDVFNAFMATVYNQAITNFPPTYHMGNQHPAPGGTGRWNAGDYGPNTNPALTVADLVDVLGDPDLVRLYYVLHNMAMQLTRVRYATLYRTNGSWTMVNVGGITALKTGLELYFPLPAPAILAGDQIRAADLNTFLGNLYTEVAARRSNGYYQHLFVAQWCHGSCHGSRGRR